MPSPSLFPNRSLRLCYWNAEKRVIDSDRANLEHHLKQLGEVKVEAITSLDSPGALPCDLLIIAAQMIPAAGFSQWLGGLSSRIQKQGYIWTPALILADMPFAILSEILPIAARENWYFDILAPAHLESLPIRVANLLRIHDHLHEIKRYEGALDDLNRKVKKMESQIESLGSIATRKDRS